MEEVAIYSKPQLVGTEDNHHVTCRGNEIKITHTEQFDSQAFPTEKLNDHLDSSGLLEGGYMQHGCVHYRRRCRIRAPCCNEIFDCRHCHNEIKNSIHVDPEERHEIPRHEVDQVICSLCGTEQEARQVCINCGVCMGKYFCETCKLFDDDTSKKQYHCNGCGICRYDLEPLCTLLEYQLLLCLFKRGLGLGGDTNEPIWHKTIVGIHGSKPLGWSSNIKAGCSNRSPWKHIHKLLSIMEMNSLFSVGRGDRVMFWHHCWVEEMPLASRFPSLYMLAKDKFHPISHFWNEELRSWIINLRRNMKEEEVEEWIALMDTLATVNLNSRDDIRIWKPDKDKGFSCKSALLVLWKNLRDDPQMNLVWKGDYPRKIKVFLWILVNDGLNTNQRWQVRNPWITLQPNRCNLCWKALENTSHLFFHCDFSRSIWSFLLNSFNLSWIFHEDSRSNIINLLGGYPTGGKKRVLWANAVRSICWNIWLERNRRIFVDKHKSLSDVWENCVLNASIWSANCKFFNSYTPSIIASNWHVFCNC